jgi:DNA-binding response OmpR family regulator
MAKILIVEDDEMLGLSMQTTFETQKHVVELVADGEEGLARLKLYKYEVVILDWGLPNVSGIEICQKFRARGGTTPMLMLTGKDQIHDKETGFQTGVDDYLTKPFDVRELVLRIEALLRRSQTYKEEKLTIKNVELNTRTRIALQDGKEMHLTAQEFSVLEFLFKRTGQYFTVQQLLEEIWTSESDSSEQAVRQCISRLRKKLEAGGGDDILKTSKGLGYRVDP